MESDSKVQSFLYMTQANTLNQSKEEEVVQDRHIKSCNIDEETYIESQLEAMKNDLDALKEAEFDAKN